MKLGDYDINDIYCEDSYKAIKNIPDKSIDCIYTDIPYLYNQGGGGNSELGERTAKKRLELMGATDKYLISIEDGIDFIILKEFVRIMKKINIFIWCSKLQILDIMNFFMKEIDKEIYFEILTWNKTNPTPTTNNSWLPDIEYCLYFREKGVLYNSGYELKSKFYISPANKSDKDKFNHPTIKPLELVKRHILHTTQKNDIVADFFMGSGTTCVACKDINRQYIGFEINPKWYKIAKDRLDNVDANGQQSMFLR